MPSHDNSFEGTHILLPFPPTDIKAEFDMEIYAHFMRHLRSVPSSRPDIRILATIQFVADMMDIQDSLVAKTLVDLGLRAPRMAFPESYLECVDGLWMRQSHEAGCVDPSLVALHNHWHTTGEDKFAAFKRCYPMLSDGLFIPA